MGRPAIIRSPRTCRNCGARFVPGRGGKRTPQTCSKACAVSLSWKRPDVAASRRQHMSASKRLPDARRRQVLINEARWARPGERERLSERNRRVWADPTTRGAMIAANTAAQNSPEVLAKHVARTNAPEWRARVSAQMKHRWAIDSKFKAAMIAASRAHHNLPSTITKKSERMKALWGDQVWRAKRRTPSGKILTSAAELIERVGRLVPRGLPDFMRADISQDILVSLFAGEIRPADLEGSVKKHVAAYYKLYPFKFGPLSIDATIPGTDGLSLADTLSSESAWP